MESAPGLSFADHRSYPTLSLSGTSGGWGAFSLQCRRILSGRNRKSSRHLWVYDSGRLGRVEIITLTEGARAKEGKGGRGGEKIFSLPAPSPLPLTRPISSSLREVSTWRFREQIARSKKTPALQARVHLAITDWRLTIQKSQMPGSCRGQGEGGWRFRNLLTGTMHMQSSLNL